MKTFSDRLKFAMAEAGLNQSALSEKTGASKAAISQYLSGKNTQVSLCLDNDKAGLVGMERLEQAIQEDPDLSQRVKLVHHNPPPAEHGKDYNEFLCRVKAAQVQQRQREGAR